MSRPLSQSQGIELVFGFEQWQLEALAEAQCEGVEAFVERLEEMLDAGEITYAQAEGAIKDFWRCR